MTDGSSKTLAIPDNVGSGVTSVAISSDGRLVAAGSRGAVRDLQSSVGIYSESCPYRWCVSGMLEPVNCWRGYKDTKMSCTVWCSPLMGVD